MGASIKHIPTGVIYSDRKEAKSLMGHYNYNRALKFREFEFLSQDEN